MAAAGAGAATQQQAMMGVASDVPKFIVNLDLPPSERWREIAERFAPEIRDVQGEIEGILGTGKVASLVTGFFEKLTKIGGVMYGEELRSISEITGAELGKVALLQVAYEVFAFCTSIVTDTSPSSVTPLTHTCAACHSEFEPNSLTNVAGVCGHSGGWHDRYGECGVKCAMRLGLSNLGCQHYGCCGETDQSSVTCRKSGPHVGRFCVGTHGSPLHGRTMDWDMPALKKLAIEVEFQRGGKTICHVSTWAGYVGVLTGMRDGAYSVSINYRRTGLTPVKVLKNFLKGAGGSWPIGFLVRDVIENDATFQTAVTHLAHSDLMAPTYITVAGAQPGEGVLITRNRNGEDARWNLGSWGSIVQTNIDHWSEDPQVDIEWSVARRSKAREALLRCVARSAVTVDDMWQILHSSPIRQHDTVYTVVMCPRTGYYATKVNCSTAEAQMAKRWWTTQS